MSRLNELFEMRYIRRLFSRDTGNTKQKKDIDKTEDTGDNKNQTQGKTVKKYRSQKEIKVENSVYKMLGIDDINKFYANKFVSPPPHNIIELDPSSNFDIAFSKQYWIYNNVTEGSRVLDIGCGSGTLNFLKSKNVYLVGIDLSENALKQALLAGYDEVVMCNGFDIPFPDRYFDFIVSLDVMGHIENEIKDFFLNEWIRLLKDNGVMLHGIENGNTDYGNLDEKAREDILIDGHVGLESFEKVEQRFKKYFRQVISENLMGICYNWHDIKKYERTEDRIGKELRDFLITFSPKEVKGFNAAMHLMRKMLLKENLLGKSGGFILVKAYEKSIR